jgi:hypothetical protein
VSGSLFQIASQVVAQVPHEVFERLSLRAPAPGDFPVLVELSSGEPLFDPQAEDRFSTYPARANVIGTAPLPREGALDAIALYSACRAARGAVADDKEQRFFSMAAGGFL